MFIRAKKMAQTWGHLRFLPVLLCFNVVATALPADRSAVAPRSTAEPIS